MLKNLRKLVLEMWFVLNAFVSRFSRKIVKEKQFKVFILPLIIYDLVICIISDAFITIFWGITEVYSKPCRTSKIRYFAKIVGRWKPLTIFAKSCILDLWQGSEYISAVRCVLVKQLLNWISISGLQRKWSGNDINRVSKASCWF